jgi:hypothetical protein
MTFVRAISPAACPGLKMVLNMVWKFMHGLQIENRYWFKANLRAMQSSSFAQL